MPYAIGTVAVKGHPVGYVRISHKGQGLICTVCYFSSFLRHFFLIVLVSCDFFVFRFFPFFLAMLSYFLHTHACVPCNPCTSITKIRLRHEEEARAEERTELAERQQDVKRLEQDLLDAHQVVEAGE